MGRRQALGWLGAAVCSVALVIAGGLVLSSVAVHRYLQASASQLQSGDARDTGATPLAAEVASLQHTVSALESMPGVAAASSTVTTGSHAKTVSYDVAVTMDADATAAESTDVVYAMTQQLRNGRVNLELTLPANARHAASVIEYRNAFDTPVARSTVESVSRAVEVAASVPGVTSVHVTVPYTWNLASGDLDVEMAGDDSSGSAALRHALARTALADVDWSGTGAPASPSSSGRTKAPSVPPAPAPTTSPDVDDSPTSPAVSDLPTPDSPVPTASATPTAPPSSGGRHGSH
ncbi:hypothetical protein GCM10022286_25720 [Gryllotalpicola daejeonensis]|uniref:Uncharacterized protein n=1 Tax=Gryllotalpicola daejeonensis TaxID=993087 RepID=A0ABP7ZM93_9MICO